jgi:sigma-B regulation protein RsbU (phosphoserine phosphatase)
VTTSMRLPSEDFEDLYRNAPSAYLSIDCNGRIVRANDTLALWIGRTADELSGTRFRDLLTVPTQILYETAYNPLLSMQGFLEEASLDLQTAAGQSLSVIAGARTVTDEGGRPVLTRLAMLRSVGRRQYERHLVEAERATRSALASEKATSEVREQFIAVLGHDLRNPLAAISAGAQLLQLEQPATSLRIAQSIERSADRMNDLIDDVLDFARGRLGGGIPVALRADVLLEPVLNQIVTELRVGAPARLIESRLDLPHAIRCDPTRIGQLVSNLLANALTHGLAAEPVRLYAATNDGQLTVWVANAGPPIPQAALEKLFQPFFRGAVRPSQQGLGLGLHIACEIAKAHGGNLTVTSTPEETRFTFHMPAEGPAASA